jgi:hypothetical protein
VKTELKFLLPKVSNEDGASALNRIISSIQATQDGVDDRERNRVYEDPYRNEPLLKDEDKAPEQSEAGAQHFFPRGSI